MLLHLIIATTRLLSEHRHVIQRRCGMILSLTEQMQVAPSLPRFKAESLPGGVRVAIPPRQDWFAIMLFGLFSALVATELFSPSEEN